MRMPGRAPARTLRYKPAGTIRITATEYAADTILLPKSQSSSSIIPGSSWSSSIRQLAFLCVKSRRTIISVNIEIFVDK
jgi:hypothetical protein